MGWPLCYCAAGTWAQLLGTIPGEEDGGACTCAHAHDALQEEMEAKGDMTYGLPPTPTRPRVCACTCTWACAHKCHYCTAFPFSGATVLNPCQGPAR